jgi:hypothetical protein
MTNKAEQLALLQKKLSMTKTKLGKAVLEKKIEKLKSEMGSSKKAKKDVTEAKKKVSQMSIAELKKKPEFSFLKGMNKGKIADDQKRVAKPKGWRFKGKGKYRKPTASEIVAGKKRGNVYYEARNRRSDVSRIVRLKDGGGVGVDVFNLSDDEILNLHLLKEDAFGKNRNSDKVAMYLSKALTFRNNGILFKAIGYNDEGRGRAMNFEEAKNTAIHLTKAYPNYTFIVRQVVGDWSNDDITSKDYVVMSDKDFSRTELSYIRPFVKYATGGGVGKWKMNDVSKAKYLGVIEFQDNEGEYHNFEVMETEDRLVFGGFTNSGFIESGYIEKDGFSTDETLQELLADLEVYYNDGKEYTSMIVVNERMAKGGKVKHSKKLDKKQKALHTGKRISESGNTYYEYRMNHADNDRRMRLEEGGSLSEPHRNEMREGGNIKMKDFKYEIYAENTLTKEKNTVAYVKAYGDIPHMIEGLQKSVVNAPVKYGYKSIK